MTVRAATAADRAAWIAFREALYEDPDADRAIDTVLADPAQIAFLLEEGGQVLGFVEVRLRAFAEGCETTPVGYIEGIRVAPQARRRGLASALVAAAEAWAREHGCTEMASDSRIDNLPSHLFHLAAGYHEVERVICYRKTLQAEPGPGGDAIGRSRIRRS